MKNFIKTHSFFIIFSFLFLLIVLLLSCQREELRENTSESRIDPNLSLQTYQNCEAHCISQSGFYYAKTAQKVVSWGGRNKNKFTKTVDIKYFNTETNFVIQVRSTNGWSDLKIDGVSSWRQGPVSANVWKTYSYPLREGWQQCNLESYNLKIEGIGPAAEFFISYNLVGVCDSCQTLFIGEAITCGDTREAIYTLTAGEDMDYIKIEGGLTDFLGDDARITILGGDFNATQSTSGNNTNRIIKIKGSIDACETAIIHIKWNSTNTGGPITENWSVKNNSGIDIAPVIIGMRCL